MNQMKRIGFLKEYLVLKKYESKGYIVYRVPMSNMPFDILAINKNTGEILFIEVKSKGSRLSMRQEMFREMIEMRSDWIVKYVVEVV